MSNKQVRFLLLIFSILLMACNAAELSPTITPGKDTAQTRVAEDATATVTPTLPHTSTPPPLAPAHTPIPLTPIPDSYVVQEERLIGDYVIQLWHNAATDSLFFENVATISANGQTLAQIEMASGFGALTGTDVTGEGNPDLIVETYSGGAHCCFSTILYDLGPTLTKLLESPWSNCGGNFQDLDGDGVFEFSTCDDTFAYAYCPYAAAPMVQVTLRYEAGHGYIPASPSFAHLYAESIAHSTEMAENATPEGMGEWDQTTKCGVLPLVLDYLYSGQADLAWSEFNRLYHYPDALLFWTEVTQSISQSPLYVAAGPSPDASLPPYYMLQMLTNCGPEWRYVGLLTEGASDCDPATPQRDVFWLDARLREINLLNDGEWLTLTPDDCTLDCRLDVMRSADDVRVGSIRLDTTGGFPGEVYRVNGVESAHWRLRGDLTWEQVSP